MTTETWPLTLIISGGQTGCDQAALRAAKALGYQTYGFAPRGWWTEAGRAPWLGSEYGLVESRYTEYMRRTAQNIRHADGTIVFYVHQIGVRSGSRATINEAIAQGKPCLELSTWIPSSAPPTVVDDRVRVIDLITHATIRDFITQQFWTVEHAFQWSKTDNPMWKVKILHAVTAAQAKYFGQRCSKRATWESERVEVMTRLVRQKFALNEELGRQLVATGDAELIEGNTWGDQFWGVCQGVGENHLGKILMQVRGELHQAHTAHSEPPQQHNRRGSHA